MDRELDGWLAKLAKAKRGGAAPMWQRRYFKLNGDMLTFYNTEEEAASGQPKWSLDLGTHGAKATPFSDPTQPPDSCRLELVAAVRLEQVGGVRQPSLGPKQPRVKQMIGPGELTKGRLGGVELAGVEQPLDE